MKKHRTLLGYALVPSGEIVNGLRANVSKLQGVINSQARYLDKLQVAQVRLKRQLASDRRYMNPVKDAAWNLVKAVEGHETADIPALAGILRLALNGHTTPPTDQVS